MSDLTGESCVPCRGGVAALPADEVERLRASVPSWAAEERGGVARLKRKFTFRDFAGAMAFANRVAEAAESEGHHPELTVGWGRVTVTWWTHVAGGLHRNDFVMAARTDRLYSEATG